jgi:hypothetical protein
MHNLVKEMSGGARDSQRANRFPMGAAWPGDDAGTAPSITGARCCSARRTATQFVWSIPHPTATSVVRTSEAGSTAETSAPGFGPSIDTCAMSFDAMLWPDDGPAWLIPPEPMAGSPCIANKPPITATAKTARAIQARQTRCRARSRVVTPPTISVQPYGLATRNDSV